MARIVMACTALLGLLVVACGTSNVKEDAAGVKEIAEVPVGDAADVTGAVETVEPVDAASDTVASDICQPNCDGKECGDDGCGGTCGECGEWWSCLSEAVDGPPICMNGVELACELVECGHSMWGDCDYWGCWDVFPWCPCAGDEICVAADSGAVISEYTGGGEGLCMPASAACGNGTCDAVEAGESCLTCAEDCQCPEGEGCVGEGECQCTSDCEDKECGDDGCGGSCGACQDGETCVALDDGARVCFDKAGECSSFCDNEGAECGLVEFPLPDQLCNCGDCGGSQEVCHENKCMDAAAVKCLDECWQAGAECGLLYTIGGPPPNCDCGQCEGLQHECVDAKCHCIPACDGLQEGDPDGCGGACPPCVEEGGSLYPYPFENEPYEYCCAGLQQVPDKHQDTPWHGCGSEMNHVCINCGDGICGPGENHCICDDCPPPDWDFED